MRKTARLPRNKIALEKLTLTPQTEPGGYGLQQLCCAYPPIDGEHVIIAAEFAAKKSRISGKSRKICRLLVQRVAGESARGKLILPQLVLPCALGPGGVTHSKREGDGCTPAGRFRMLGGYFRLDRAPRPTPTLKPIRRNDGWCDAPDAACYNRPVTLPYASSHEQMWREDRCYDVVIVLDYNMHPRVRGRGSAIFFHLARENFPPTAGCIAIRPEDMRRLLPRLNKTCVMVVR